MAGALWGAVIVAPALIPDVHPVVISCVRFLLYGLFATLIALPNARALISRLTRQDQRLLLELALTGNLVYFILLSAAVQHAGVATASLINGLIPVAVMLMGRRFSHVSGRSMFISLALICTGILWINLPAVTAVIRGEGSMRQVMGAAYAGLGVLSWSWFALRNAHQLKTGRFTAGEWSTLLGITTGFAALLMSALVVLVQPELLPTDLALERLTLFMLTALFMAIGGSWVANTLWNASAQRLPVSIGGQLIVFESLCALLYSFLIAWALPSTGEVLGISLVLGGVFWTIRAERRTAILRRLHAT
ncbi:DMT family transporter [uncultured Pseudomonas sp.]|uniref:DMT family transporter n=1 Tax=uncultured Pseudomonas sp. TaxID=114707 RepID=UPI0026361B1C|nr:DMT family transporter [uncultured Pseudomonas sp.]